MDWYFNKPNKLVYLFQGIKRNEILAKDTYFRNFWNLWHIILLIIFENIFSKVGENSYLNQRMPSKFNILLTSCFFHPPPPIEFQMWDATTFLENGKKKHENVLHFRPKPYRQWFTDFKNCAIAIRNLHFIIFLGKQNFGSKDGIVPERRPK